MASVMTASGRDGAAVSRLSEAVGEPEEGTVA